MEFELSLRSTGSIHRVGATLVGTADGPEAKPQRCEHRGHIKGENEQHNLAGNIIEKRMLRG